MPFLFQYLIKFSLSLAVLYIFYFVVLRPLTFYQWNRFYLLGYALLSFIIPFINITDWLTGKNIKSNLINSIPAVNKFTSHSFDANLGAKNILHSLLSWLSWNFMGFLFLSGAFVMLTRMVYQYLSLRAMKRRAVLLKTGDFEFYDVNGPITPFSFANAIFINSRLHTEDEFHRILEHEFVHVKQKHTIDIVVAELICIFNWFNPFAWLIRKVVRQNLEFIADKNVLEGGIDPRQYQYLLLKVMGLPQFSIANNFSFSSLKKRITMMNKMRTARVHLVKFLFVLPLLSVMLLAFRERINKDPATYLNGSISNIEKVNAAVDRIGIKQVYNFNKDTILKKYGLNAGIIHVVTHPEVGSDTIPHVTAPPAPPQKVEIQTLIAAPIPPVTAPVPKVKPATVTIAGLTYSPDELTDKKIAIVNVTPVAPVVAIDTNPAERLIKTLHIYGGEPLYIIDGEQQQAANFKKLDPNSISSIQILKDASAKAIYGDKAEFGVIIINTKKESSLDDSVSLTASKIYINKINEITGLIIVNGKEISKEKLAAIDPKSIQSVSVLKNSSATSLYGEKGKEGVIVITLKK